MCLTTSIINILLASIIKCFIVFSVLNKHRKDVNHPDRKAEIVNCWVKDALQKYVDMFPPASSHLEKNIDRCLYGQGKYKSYYFSEMLNLYVFYRAMKADPQIGDAEERKKAFEAYQSMEQWLKTPESRIHSAET